MGLPSSDERNLSVVARSGRSSSGRDLSSQYLKTSDRIEVWVGLRSEHLAQQQRPEGVDAGAHLGAQLARERQELDRVPLGRERPAHRAGAVDDGLVGGVAGRREARQVALDVGHEDRHAGVGQLARQQLERLGLAGAGGACDEPMAVHHRAATCTRASGSSSAPFIGLPSGTPGWVSA